MIVASLIDAGADERAVRAAIDGLGLTGYTLSIEKVNKQGLAATRFQVTLDASAPQPHRHLKHVVEIITNAKLAGPIKARAIQIFTRLAEAEAAVHGTTIEKVHFHEVGAVDAIIDIVSAVVALDSLGVTSVHCAVMVTGSGTVACAHGVMPVPAPATANLLRGIPLAPCDEVGELTTPTAAAVLTTLASRFGPMPGMTVRTIGYGAGTREGSSRPNVLRVFVGEECGNAESETDEVAVLETNLDDVSPEIVAHSIERLFDAGVLDAYTLPIQMKKGRTGVLLTVLCEPDRAAAIEQVIFAETGTFGVRRHNARRSKLVRRHETVETSYGPIRVKVGVRGQVVSAAPEFEDCKAAAGRHGVPIRLVFDAARAAWLARGSS